MPLIPQVREQLLEVVPFADRGDDTGAWKAARPLLSAWRDDVDVAAGLALLVGHRRLNRSRRLQLANDLLDTYPFGVEVLYGLGSAAEGLWGQRFLNAAPPSEQVFNDIVVALRLVLSKPQLDADFTRLTEVLASAASVTGRVCDGIADEAYRSVLKRRRRQRWEDWYNYGLHLKTRGRWEESLEANRRAVEHGGGGDESVRWNLGIVSTAAGRGDIALKVWRDLQQDVTLGDDGLPHGPYDPVQVRLAQRPVAERGVGIPDSPGLEEAVWVERMSPCHGVVRSEPMASLGVHFGDVVLFDGTPLYHRPWRGQTVPVFAHLTTLRSAGYRVYPFVGVESSKGQISALVQVGLERVVPCVHVESAKPVCAGCMRPGEPHEDFDGFVVEGVLCVAPEQPLDEVQAILDEGVSGLSDPWVRIVVPGLYSALGDAEREADLRQIEHCLVSGCAHADGE